MDLIPSSPNKKNATSATAQPGALQGLKPIRIPKGGAYRNKTKKLRAEGILGPTETLEEYNQRIQESQANGLDSDSDANPSPRESDLFPPAESIEMEPQGEKPAGGFGGLLARATQALKDDDSPKLSQSKKVTPKAREDFSVLVVSVVTLLVTFAKVDERVKPNGDEINIFSEHISGIMLRHLPISNKMSADALDIIGLMAVTATWYSRVHADLNPGPVADRAQPQQTPVKANGHKPQTPIEAASPQAGEWLNTIAARSEGFA
jgi:hypothetical protein